MTLDVKQVVQNVQEQTHFVIIDIQFPGFSTKASKEDYGSSVTLDVALDTGSIKLVDPSELNNFHSARRLVRNTLSRLGICIVPGAVYLITDSKVLQVQAFLEEVHAKIIKNIGELKHTFEQSKQRWWEQNPNIRSKIEALAPAWADVESKFIFEVTMFPMGEQRFSELGDGGLTQKMESASSTAISSICQIASSYNPKEGVDAKFAIGRLNTMAEKARELAIIDPTGRLELLADYVETLIDKLPQEGKLDGYAHLQVSSALAFMGSERQVQEWLATKQPTQSVMDRLTRLTQSSQPSDDSSDVDLSALLDSEDAPELDLSALVDDTPHVSDEKPKTNDDEVDLNQLLD